MSDSSFYDPQWTVLQKLKYIENWAEVNSIRTATIGFEVLETTSDSMTIEVYGTNFKGDKITLPAITVPIISGESATIKVGTTKTVDAGENAKVTNSGTESAAVLDFEIPRGAVGTSVTGANLITENKLLYRLELTLSDGQTIVAGYINLSDVEVVTDSDGNTMTYDPETGTVNDGDIIYKAVGDHVEAVGWTGELRDGKIPEYFDWFGTLLYVTKIADNAFDKCRTLYSLELTENITEIGAYAFRNCTLLTEINFNGISVFGEYAFYNCSNILAFTLDGMTGSVPDYCFYGCSRPTAITFPDGLESIGNYAFYQCTGLTSVTFPDGLESIGNYAFSGCSGLTSVTIPDGLESIGNYAFYQCTGLTSVTIPDGLESIGNYAFYQCTGLTSVTFPDGLESIGNYAFSGCSGLTSVTIPDGLESIGNYAFYQCTGLTSVTFPDGLESIGNSAFSGCSGLTSVTLPKGVLLYRYAFRSLSVCKEFTCPAITISSDGNGESTAYSSGTIICTAAENVHITGNITMSGSSVSKSYQYRSMQFGNSNTGTNVYFGNEMTQTTSYMFYLDTYINNIYIAKSVSKINSNTFYGLKSLTGKIYYEGTADEIDVQDTNELIQNAEWVYNWDGEPVD